MVRHLASATGGPTRPGPTRGIRSRVTVVDGERRVDLSVPTSEPVVAWLPAAIAQIGPAQIGPAQLGPAELGSQAGPETGSGDRDRRREFGEIWTLRTAVGSALDTSASLAHNAVADGAVLHLERADVSVPEVRTSTVLGEISAGAPAALTGAARVVTLNAVSGSILAAGMLAGTVAGARSGGAALVSVATALLAVAVVAGASCVFTARMHDRDGAGTAVRYGAATTLVAAVLSAVSFALPSGIIVATLACSVAALLAGAVLWAGGPGTRPAATAAGAVAIPLVLAAILATAADASTGQLAAAALLGWTLTLPTVPRVCATSARLAGSTGRVDPDRLGLQVGGAREAMAWSVVALSVAVSLVAPIVLVTLGRGAGPWGYLLVGLAVVMCANLVRTMTERLLATSLLAAVALVSISLLVALVGLWLGEEADLGPLLLAAAAVVSTLIGVAAWPTPPRLPTPELLRLMKTADLLARVAMVPVLLGCFGVFDWAIALGTDLGDS